MSEVSVRGDWEALEIALRANLVGRTIEDVGPKLMSYDDQRVIGAVLHLSDGVELTSSPRPKP